MMWKKMKLGDVCNFQNGRAFKKSEWSESGLPIIRIQNLKNETTEHNFYEGEYDERIFVTNGDVLLSWSGTIKPFIWCHGDALLNQHVFKVSVSKELNQGYAFYLFQNILHDISKQKVGIGLQHITKKTFDNFPIILPPLAEQQRIVAKLDAAFAEIDRAIDVVGEQIQENHNLFASTVEAMFKKKSGWVKKTLQEICEKITDGTHQTPTYFEDGYIFLSSKNVTTRKVDWDNIKYIDEEQHKAMQKRLSPKVGDILLAKNGTTGVAAMVDRDVEFDIYVSLALLRSKGEVIPDYMLQFINSNAARAQFAKRTKGIGVPNLHLKEIREVEISFPVDTLEQQKVTNVIDKIDALYQRRDFFLCEKKANLYQLKSAILAQVLNQSEAA